MSLEDKTMRVTNSMITANFLANIRKGMESLYKAQEQIATGKKVTRLSDDPVSLRRINTLQSALSGRETYIRAIDNLVTVFNEADDALGRALGALSSARDIAVQAANGTLSASDRVLLSEKVDGLIREVAAAGNVMVGDKYIFAGYKTDTCPFVVIPDGETPPGGGVLYGNVAYYGDTNEIINEIAPGDLISFDLNGGKIFGDSGVFDNLYELKTLLAGNDVAGISSQIDRLNANMNELIQYRTNAGAKVNRLENLGNHLRDQQVRLLEQISVLGDADIEEVVTRFNEQRLTYESALAAGSRLMHLSLLDFLR